MPSYAEMNLLNLPVASHEKAYAILGYEDNYVPLTFGASRDKARSAFFKKNQCDFDDDFIGFCKDFKFLRWHENDRFVFSLPEFAMSLPDDAKSLITAGVLSDRKYLNNNKISVLNSLFVFFRPALTALLNKELIELEHAGKYITHYRINQKGHQLQLALLSQKKPLSISDVKKLTYVWEQDNQDNRISLSTLKDMECIVPYSVIQTLLPEVDTLILSGQWGAYWRAGASGYSTEKEQAGRYTLKEAYDITHHCGNEKSIVFVILDDEDKA